MTYYLISEKDQHQICFVKDENCASFCRNCKQKILVHGSNIITMLSLLDDELVKAYSFCSN